MRQTTSEHALTKAQAMFQRALRGWAQDLMRLRARGADRPGRRRTRGLGIPAPVGTRRAA